MFLSFILTCIIMESTPGPNMAYLAMISAGEGRRYGFAAVAGVALGLLVMGMATAIGTETLMMESPWVFNSLRWCGAAYLLWLAWDGWRTAGRELVLQDHNCGGALLRFFRRGFITNMLNPKAAVFYLTVLPGFSDAQMPTMTLAIIYVAVATIIHAAIVLLAGAATAFLAHPRRRARVQRILAAMLAAVALWFVFETGRGVP